MSPCDKTTHVGYITDNTDWYNVLSIIEKHRFCEMIPVESNISLKSISWIIFLLRSYLAPFCSAFVGTGLVFSTGYHSSLANGKALKQTWGVPVFDQCSGQCPSQPCSSPGCLSLQTLISCAAGTEPAGALRVFWGHTGRGKKRKKNHIFNSPLLTASLINIVKNFSVKSHPVI